jgi:large subunit ribosomal protein L11
MTKEIKTLIKLQINAGQANPSPPVGPALGQHGINIMSFCKDFNSKTSDLESGTPVPVVITVYLDKSFSFLMKTTPTSFLLKKILNVSSGSSNALQDIIGSISKKQLEDVALIKIADLTAYSINAAIKTIAGTAKSMGINVE